MMQMMLATLLFLALPIVGSSEVAMGTISGVVKNPRGEAIDLAIIEIENASSNASRKTLTAPTGTYSIANLAPGTYRVSVSAPGLPTVTKSGVVVRPREHLTIDFRLAQIEPARSIRCEFMCPA